MKVLLGLAVLAAPVASATHALLYVPEEEHKIVPEAVDTDHRFPAAIAVGEEHVFFGSAYDNEGGEVLVYERTDGEPRLEERIASPAEGAKFGEALAFDDGRLLVGAPGADVGEAYGAGAAYLFEEASDGDWVQAERFMSPDPENLDAFGRSVAVDGGTIAVGEPADDRSDRDPAEFGADGAVHVFAPGSGGYVHEQKILPPSDDDQERLGMAIAFHEETLVVGAPDDGGGISSPGAVFVYEETDGGWQLSGSIQAPLLAETINFGQRLAVDGDTLVIGAPGPKTWTCCSLLVTGPKGQAFAYTFDHGGWSYESELVPAMQTPASRHGAAVALEEDTAYVAAPMAPLESAEGIVSVFERTGEIWRQTGQVQHEGAEAWDQLGKSLAVDGDRLYAAAPGDSEAGHRAGAVYVFTPEGSHAYPPMTAR